jgi:hypothetical protein
VFRQVFLLEQKIQLLQGQLQLEIGENFGIRGVASWKWRKQWKLDQDALKRDEPQISIGSSAYLPHASFAWNEI